MPRILSGITLGFSLAFLVSVGYGQEAKATARTFHLDTLEGLEVVNTKAEVVTYRGRRAVRLAAFSGQDVNAEQVAVLTATEFKDGTIEAEVAGAPRAGAPAYARGFIGIGFRVQPHATHFECFYLRPTNARAADQLSRNHSAQYISSPDFPWERLRKETPGAYESYVDLEPGAWTHVKIVVSGHVAQLYVNGASQPCLMVNDLKLGESHGQILLWTESTTDAYFSNLTVR